ncbi:MULTISPECIES: hypothetical protein [unclassified Microbacterium]|uniref:hypothetical protein n=1 Tax=unclassified Microbacterium TaxID=2609290 RepID=UPI00214B8B47|nr:MULTISPECIES: hypothetical protein [unclassified Microbacterium]MCR2810988.1 hypothetical protein [Microbacterium sp. zg.B185]WIM19614.1 hypothetical protein QNO12_02060 [Microbacterium sp. zg-B185]
MNEGRHGQAGGAGAPQRFVLARVDARHWVIHDRRSGTASAGVAARLSVSDDDDEVHVTWFSVTPLPIVYATPGDVLTSLEMWQSRPHGGTKPIPIPHFPPPRHNDRSSAS